MSAAMAGLARGEFQEGHQLSAKMIKRIPEEYVGRCLSAGEADRVIRLMERERA